MQNLKCKIQNVLILFCTLHFALCIGCSIPNLDEPGCADVRDALRTFYSFHLDNGINFNRENLNSRRKFLTAELFQTLEQKAEGAKDYFTDSDEPPKSFRVGGCRIIDPDKKIDQDVILFWRDDAKEENRQKIVRVEAININKEWLINKVEAK